MANAFYGFCRPWFKYSVCAQCVGHMVYTVCVHFLMFLTKVHSSLFQYFGPYSLCSFVPKILFFLSSCKGEPNSRVLLKGNWFH